MIGVLTPRDTNAKEKFQTWGTPEEANKTTERVFAMLEMNQKIISKYHCIKNEQLTLASPSPIRPCPLNNQHKSTNVQFYY